MKPSNKLILRALALVAAIVWLLLPTSSASSNPISLNFQAAAPADVFQSLFTQAGLNYAIAPEVSEVGLITLALKDTTFDVALRTLCQTYRLTYTIVDTVYIIKTKSADQPGVLIQEIVEPVATEEAKLTVCKIQLKYVNAEDLVAFLKTGTLPQNSSSGMNQGSGYNLGSGSGNMGYNQGMNLGYQSGNQGSGNRGGGRGSRSNSGSGWGAGYSGYNSGQGSGPGGGRG